MLSGKYEGKTAEELYSSKNPNCYIFQSTEHISFPMHIDNKDLGFLEIRNIYLNKREKYYRSGPFPKLVPITNSDLLLQAEISFNMVPEGSFDKIDNLSAMYYEIKKSIIGQDEQIKKMLEVIYKNQKAINSGLSNEKIAKLKEDLLIIGEAGVGKTEIIKIIRELYHIPMAIINLGNYCGESRREIMTRLLNNMYYEANQNLEKAEQGILVLNDFEVSDWDGNIERTIFDLLTGEDYYIDNRRFRTDKLTIIGISCEKSLDNVRATTKKFTKYFSNVVYMNRLNVETLKRILKESNISPINVHKELLNKMGVNLEYDEEFIEYVANKAYNNYSSGGALALKYVFDRMLKNAMYEIATGDYNTLTLQVPSSDKPQYVLK